MVINNWVMLTSVVGHWLTIQLRKVFMEKKKKTINILTTFFISHKSDVKTFLK